MKNYLFYIIPFILVAAFGCRKREYPKPVAANDSFFYSKLLVNGQPVEITTGKNKFYMYSSFSIDSSNVYNLTGEFKQTDCNGNCTNNLKIQINDSKVSSPASSILIDSALQIKSYSFLSGLNDLGFSVDFKGTFNKSYSSVLWDFGDGHASTDINPTHIFRAGKYKVTLTITGLDGCQSVVSNTLSLFSPSDLNTYATALGATNTVTFSANPNGGKSPYTYLWDFGDGNTSVYPIVTHTYALKGGYLTRLEVTDSKGAVTNCYYNAVAGGDPSACAANFSFSNITQLQGRLGLSKVSIRYTDSNGVTYTSDNSAQPENSSLEILSIDEFVKNESNQPVKKLGLKFNCTLYNGTQSVSLQGTEVHVGVAYK